jgi:hypothetical protein
VAVRMFYPLWLALFLALGTPWAQRTTPAAQAGAQTGIPDSPAGRTFTAWLTAFNNGDRASIEAYCHKYEPSKSVENEVRE